MSEINKHSYDRWASFYDHYPNSTVFVDDHSFPPAYASLRSQRVLEIGCGTGRHTRRLIAQGNRVTGVDLSAGMLAVAREKIESPALELIEGDFLTLPLPADFDAAISSLVVEHFRDLPAFFSRVFGLLRSRGIFHLSEIHPSRTAKGSKAHFVDPASQEEVSTASFPHTTEEIRAAALGAGFEVLKCESILGEASLPEENPEWARYLGKPMIEIWAFRKP